MTKFFVGEKILSDEKLCPTKILFDEIFSPTKTKQKFPKTKKNVQNKNLNKEEILFSR